MSVEEENEALAQAIEYDKRIRSLPNLYAELRAFLKRLESVQDPFSEKLTNSLAIIEEALDKFRYVKGSFLFASNILIYM